MKTSAVKLSLAFLGIAFALPVTSPAQTAKPAITLDEFLNTTEIAGARISPDGTAAVIGTENPDWKNNTFRHTLWLWTARDGLRALTQSGSDEDAQWSPDGKWIAFLSDRPVVGGESGGEKDSGGDAGAGDAKGRPARASDADDKTTRLWLIPLSGGEARPLYREKLEVHTFAWTADGKAIFLSATAPLTHDQEDARKEEWKDVVRWREQERGDLLLALPVEASLAEAAAQPMAHDPKNPKDEQGSSAKDKSKDAKLPLPAGALTVATSKLEISEIAPSPGGKSVAFLTQSVSHRMENPADTEIGRAHV